MNQTERAVAGRAGDESIRQLMAGTFKGKLAWMAAVCWVYLLILAALLVIAAVMFFRAEQTGGQIMWATVFLASFVGALGTKIMYWMLMFRAAAMRRLDHLELMIAAQRRG